jgi:hypothetical protein
MDVGFSEVISAPSFLDEPTGTCPRYRLLGQVDNFRIAENTTAIPGCLLDIENVL